MKVGDLVRHEMYSEKKVPAIVLIVEQSSRIGRSMMIKILDPDDGFAKWDVSLDYEVVSESR